MQPNQMALGHIPTLIGMPSLFWTQPLQKGQPLPIQFFKSLVWQPGWWGMTPSMCCLPGASMAISWDQFCIIFVITTYLAKHNPCNLVIGWASSFKKFKDNTPCKRWLAGWQICTWRCSAKIQNHLGCTGHIWVPKVVNVNIWHHACSQFWKTSLTTPRKNIHTWWPAWKAWSNSMKSLTAVTSFLRMLNLMHSLALQKASLKNIHGSMATLKSREGLCFT